jgi:hypothetical protein
MIINLSNDWIYQQYVKEFGNRLLPSDFYYNKQGYKVMTESYHRRRGSCCGNGCLHCPYEPKHKKGNTNLGDIY